MASLNNSDRSLEFTNIRSRNSSSKFSSSPTSSQRPSGRSGNTQTHHERKSYLMKFSQVNLNRSHTAANDLTAFLADHHGQSELISLIQEPYCYRNKVCCLNKKNMDLLYKQGSGRTLSLIHI